MERKADRNERFVAECLRRITTAPDPETGLRQLLRSLGETLRCQRVYVFEDMDRQYLRNTYEWCAPGMSSGIEQLPYVTKKDLDPWYSILTGGESVIETDVSVLERENPLIYSFLAPQGIRSLVLTPLMDHGKVTGLLGADNPPPDSLDHVSVVFGVLAYFVTALLGQRDLARLRPSPEADPAVPPVGNGRTVLLVDGSRELLRLNTRILRPVGYALLCALDPEEAIAMLELTRPDAVVVDGDLPGMERPELCRTLMERAGAPVVVLTSHAGLRLRKGRGETGACTFITKPYGLEELRRAVAAACEKKAGAIGPTQLEKEEGR